MGETSWADWLIPAGYTLTNPNLAFSNWLLGAGFNASPQAQVEASTTLNTAVEKRIGEALVSPLVLLGLGAVVVLIVVMKKKK